MDVKGKDLASVAVDGGDDNDGGDARGKQAQCGGVERHGNFVSLKYNSKKGFEKKH